ncbi:hypothetical protein [Propionispora vibrioides]|nr:hypothetical protein [Propionispora vibrioides]
MFLLLLDKNGKGLCRPGMEYHSVEEALAALAAEKKLCRTMQKVAAIRAG